MGAANLRKSTILTTVTTKNGYKLESTSEILLSKDNYSANFNYNIGNGAQFEICTSFLSDLTKTPGFISYEVDPDSKTIHVIFYNWENSSGSNNDIITKKTYACTIDNKDYYFELWVHTCNNTGTYAVTVLLYSKYSN